MPRYAVTGGRDFLDKRAVWHVLRRLLEKHPNMVLVHGQCPTGADFIAHRWAYTAGVETDAYPANWRKYKGGAGPKRNRAMARSGLDGCVAFPGGRGTADMVACCRALGVTVWWPVGGEESTMAQLRPGWTL